MAKIRTDLPDDHRLAEHRGRTGDIQSNIAENPENEHFDFEFVPDSLPGVFFFVDEQDIEH